MKKLLLEIEDLKVQIDKLEPISDENKNNLWGKFRLEWNYNSNHLEGNTMTLAQTKSLLHFGDEFKFDNVTLKEVREMQGHDFAIIHLQKLTTDSERMLTQNDICELNETILVKPFWKEAITPSGSPTRKQITPGKYKEQSNHVKLSDNTIFKYSEPNEVPAEMTDLLDWYKTKIDLEVVAKAALFHYKFVRIHPFDDGNGRVSRLLMNYHLMRNGYPPVIIKSEDKQNYFYALRQADNGDLEAFVKYIGQQLLWSMSIKLKAIQGESIEEEADLEKRIEIFTKKINSQVPNSTKRSTEKCAELYELSILKLFGLAESELVKISNIFVEATFKNYYNSNQSAANLITSTKLLELKKDRQDYLNSFILSIQYRDVINRKEIKKAIFNNQLIVVLKPFSYEIELTGNRKIEHSYDELLDIHEMNLIADDLKRKIFDEIETSI